MENKGVFGRNLDSRRNISDLDSLKKNVSGDESKYYENRLVGTLYSNLKNHKIKIFFKK